LSFWQVIGAFLAPTTTVTALLFYFGWVRASTTYGGAVALMMAGWGQEH